MGRGMLGCEFDECLCSGFFQVLGILFEVPTFSGFRSHAIHVVTNED